LDQNPVHRIAYKDMLELHLLKSVILDSNLSFKIIFHTLKNKQLCA